DRGGYNCQSAIPNGRGRRDLALISPTIRIRTDAASRALRRLRSGTGAGGRMAHLSERGLDSPESGLEIFGRTDAHLSNSEDSAFQMILAARHGRSMLLAEYLPELRLVDSGGILDRCDGIRREPRIREQLEAEAIYGRSRSLREPGRSRDSVLDTFFLEHPKSLAKREEEWDGWRVGRVLFRESIDVGLEIRVERGVGVKRVVRPFGEGDGAEARRCREAFLRTHHERVDAPRVHLVLESADGRDAVDDQECIVGLHDCR